MLCQWKGFQPHDTVIFIPPITISNGGYIVFTLSVCPSVRVSVCPCVRALAQRWLDQSEWYLVWWCIIMQGWVLFSKCSSKRSRSQVRGQNLKNHVWPYLRNYWINFIEFWYGDVQPCIEYIWSSKYGLHVQVRGQRSKSQSWCHLWPVSQRWFDQSKWNLVWWCRAMSGSFFVLWVVTQNVKVRGQRS